MRKIIFILFILPFCLKAQVYKAGDTLASYLDINPDTLLSFGGQYHLESYSFDITNDLQNDFKIESYSSGGLGGATRYINIVPLNANSFTRFGRTDSVYNNYLSYWQKAQIAKPLNYGDTINSMISDWRSQSLSMTNNTGMTGTYLYTNDFVSTNDLYVPIKYESVTDTILGWIRVHCPNNANCYVKDYSFSKCSNSTLIVTSSSSVICASQSATLTASGATSYSWSTNELTPDIIVTPTITTSYLVTGINAFGCSLSSVITQNVTTSPSITISAPNSTICVTDSTTLSASGADTYLWSTGETASDIIITPGITTTYTVVGTNNYGCSSISIITQSVSTTCVGVKEYELRNINIYPNPATNVLQILDEGHDFHNSKIEVTNYLGQTVLVQNYADAVDVSKLSTGLYKLKIVTPGKQSVYAKFIKE